MASYTASQSIVRLVYFLVARTRPLVSECDRDRARRPPEQEIEVGVFPKWERAPEPALHEIRRNDQLRHVPFGLQRGHLSILARVA